jgi:hypothetical protein
MNDREPIVVEKPTQITPLEAALNALNTEITSKHLRLEPAPWRALREYVAELATELTEYQTALISIMGGGCENYITQQYGACIQDRPYGRYAMYTAARWCDSCIAYEVLTHE